MMPKETGGSREEADAFYAKGQSMLRTLGLERYEKNLRKGMITDATLPLLTDRRVLSSMLLLQFGSCG